MEERVFSLFQNESYKEKFPYINVKESGNIFWQCDLIEAIIYNSEIVKDDLNIFERTILKMIDYHGYSSKELSEIICIEEDLVEYLIKKILEKGLLVDRYTVSESGKQKLEKNQSKIIDSLPIKIKLFRLNGEYLPYIHTYEKFFSEKVTESSNNRLKVNIGDVANEKEIAGYYIKQKKNNKLTSVKENILDLAKEDRKVRKKIKEYNKLCKKNNLNKVYLSPISKIKIIFSGKIIFHSKYVFQDGNIKHLLISDGFLFSVDNLEEELKNSRNSKILEKLKENIIKIKIEDNNTEKKFQTSQREYFEIYKALEICKQEKIQTKDQSFESNKKNQNKIDKCRVAIEWTLNYYLKENSQNFDIIYKTFAGKDHKTNGSHLEKILKEYNFKYNNRVNFFKSFKISDKKILFDTPNLKYLLPLLIIESNFNKESLVFKLKEKHPDFIDFMFNVNQKSKEYRHNSNIENFEKKESDEIYRKTLSIIKILLPKFMINNIDKTNQDKYDASQKILNSEYFFKEYFGKKIYELMDKTLKELCMELTLDEKGNTLIKPFDYINTLSRILEQYLYIILKDKTKDFKEITKEKIISKISEKIDINLPDTLKTVNPKRIGDIFSGQKTTLGAEILAFLYIYYIIQEKEGIGVYSEEVGKKEFVIKFIENVDTILRHRGHGTDISLMLPNDLLLEYRNKIFDFIKIIEKEDIFY